MLDTKKNDHGIDTLRKTLFSLERQGVAFTRSDIMAWYWEVISWDWPR